ncbi:hypothetical protein ACU19_04830 [Actinobaculum suis]|uniref:hypothetical protein n=1 Tax=Actinobaculum suis TaxID=1657 RepID=UPI00066FE7ED|nr:hypothetical protein [Actinobaculum suis]KMY23302.1 hypothetical protein ACU19_04830 [Actinobaculum suis]
MLITMPTLTDSDLAAWEEHERYDYELSKSFTPRIEQALDAIREFTSQHEDAVCATSWGKDSVVVCWLTRVASPHTPIVWVPTIRADGVSYEAEATYRVRDAFLETWPGPYSERPAVARNPKRGDPGYSPDQYDRAGYRSQDVLRENIPEPSINGVRAEESQMRRNSARWHGIVSAHTARPILYWPGISVFAALACMELPTHPAYAASYGGTLDRRFLRVHALRSKPPARSSVYGRDMDTWEDTYFPELIEHRPWVGEQRDEPRIG